MTDAAALARMIKAGAGEVPADLVVRDVQLLDVITGAVTRTDVAIVADRIVGTHAAYRGTAEIDGRGRFCVPGFIDTHLHIESSLVTPFEFDRLVLPHGVTTAICDPHEIANVLGLPGIRYFLDCAERTVMDLRVNLSSCVPATAFETSGAALGVDDLLSVAGHPKVIGLAEFMNFPGVLAAEPAALEKLAAFQGRHIDGHAPLLRGMRLNGYLAAGIRTDHEATTAEEAREKLAKGMTILIREGSVSKDLAALAEVLDEQTSPFMALCTDDRNPLDIAEEGHIDGLVRMLLERGRPLHHVYRAASWSAARAFGLSDRGLVAPGWRADLVLLDDLRACAVSEVVSAGRIVDAALFDGRQPVPAVGYGSIRAPVVGPHDFRVAAPGNGSASVIGVKPGLIITAHETMDVPAEDGALKADPERDLIKVAVVERHGRNGNIATGLVRGFGLKRGAIASSVGHDSHNITVIGVAGADMAAAVHHLVEVGGGFVVIDGGRVLGDLPLPVAGLMSDRTFDEVRESLERLRSAAKELGCMLPEPFLQAAFLPLPVIPHLKITDRGLFDVDRFELMQS